MKRLSSVEPAALRRADRHNQYMVHSEMNHNWGYERLHKKIEKIAIDEMKHAEKLIARILFLEGAPTVSNSTRSTLARTCPS